MQDMIFRENSTHQNQSLDQHLSKHKNACNSADKITRYLLIKQRWLCSGVVAGSTSCIFVAVMMVWQIITWWAVWLVGIILYKSIGAATARQTLKSQCNDWWDFPGRVIFSEWKNIHNLKPGRCDRLSLGMGTCVKKKVAKICSTYNQKVLKKETFSSSRRAKRHIRVEKNWFQMPLSSPNWEYCGPWST